MKFSERIVPILVTGVLLLGIGTMAARWFWPDRGAVQASIKLPRLSAIGGQGKLAFEAYCASCHGVNAAGTDKGPPLLNDIYNPGHHPDESFYLAAKQGVRAHHWAFGNMPPQPQVSKQELANIARYIREMQEANGIFYRSHTM
ncbi:MAG: cytochrome c [Fimbriimonadaceae bacterium]|nr:cytochrome c [Alphaproteobacteria bacterium]